MSFRSAAPLGRMPGATPLAWPRRSTLARVILLGVVLGVHLETRLWTHLNTPPDQKRFWSSSYLVSLSLLSGHGFSYLLPVDASTETAVMRTELRSHR